VNVNHLRADAIVKTVHVLQQRIVERFPRASLNQVCGELHRISEAASARSKEIASPIYAIRIVSTLIILAILGVFIYAFETVRIPQKAMQATELIQVVEAGFNALVLVGATVIFVMTLEVRYKRARALKALHELRSLVHIIDMHQLTKDPERLVRSRQNTKSSPVETMSLFELNRYLDYCSEMLALCGKVAALYVEHFPDSQAVAAVNDLENLTSGLARKIWQKIMVLHHVLEEEHDGIHERNATQSKPVSEQVSEPHQGDSGNEATENP